MVEKNYLRAKTGFMLPGPIVVKAGQVVASTDAVVKGREELFEPMEETIETATRAPGELRLTPRRNEDAVVMTAVRRRGGGRRRGAQAPGAAPAGASQSGSGNTAGADAESAE